MEQHLCDLVEDAINQLKKIVNELEPHELFKIVRQRQQMTQNEVYKLTSIVPQEISGFENGKYPSENKVLLLLTALIHNERGTT